MGNSDHGPTYMRVANGDPTQGLPEAEVVTSAKVVSPVSDAAGGGRCRATWKREFKLPRREVGPPNHHDGKEDSDQ